MLFLYNKINTSIFFIGLFFIWNFNYSQSISSEFNDSNATQLLATQTDSVAYVNELFKIADSLSIDSQYKALAGFQKALNFVPTSEYKLRSNILYQLGKTYTLVDDYPKALEVLFNSLEINNQFNDSTSIRRDMSQIGYVHDRMYDYRESITWNRRALKIAEIQKDTNAIAICLGRIGIAYDELAEMNNFNKRLFDSALYYNSESARLSELAKDYEFARRTYSNLGNTYSKLKNYEKAEEYTIRSLNVKGSEKNKGVTLVNLGKIYLETGRYKEAEKILDSALNHTIYYGTRKYQFEAYYRFHELAIKKGDYQDALKNYIAYKSLEDSLLNETKTMQIAEMTERFRTAEKEIELAETRADLAETQLDIKTKNIQLIGILITLVVVAALSYLIYNQQKLKNRQLQKENELKDALVKIETQNRLQEQRLRISRDLHDNIGAQLTFIISSIDNLKYGFEIPNKLSNKLDNISSFTSTTIRELRDTIWAMNKSDISFEDLKSRISNFMDKANKAASDIDYQFIIDEEISNDKIFTSVEGMNIYRIIQEALNNAIKYANADQIIVRVNQQEDHLKITISDNGKGFNLSEIELGNGLNNMKKRAEEIGGGLEVSSDINKGTIITLLA
ncbi:MAG: tetratricopeptide repeat-containing sensor histidine kinase [bacterium]